MSIIYEDEAELPKKPTPPQTHKVETYNSPIIKSRPDDGFHLIQHIEGSKWIVTFFHQLVTEDNSPSAIKLDQENVYKSYLKIDEYELKVTSPLSQGNYDSKNSEFSLEGEAYMFSVPIPHVGDLFFGDMGDGRTGIFNIKSAEPKSYMHNTVYEIKYELMAYLTPEYKYKIENSVVESSIFKKEFLSLGKNPILLDEQFKDYELLKQFEYDLPFSYFLEFFCNTTKTLLIPSQRKPSYDPYVIECFLKLISSGEHPWVIQIKEYNTNMDNKKPVVTLLNLLTDGYNYSLNHLQPILYLTSTRNLPRRTGYNTLRFSQIDLFMHHHHLTETTCYNKEKLLPSKEQRNLIKKDLSLQISEVVLDGLYEPTEFNTKRIDFYKITEDEFYIFSKYFYKQDLEKMSLIEVCVYNYINNLPLDIKSVIRLAQLIKNMDSLEKFYYIPIILILIRIALQELN